MGIPFVLFALAVVCMTLWLYHNAIASSSLYQLVVDVRTAAKDDTTAAASLPAIEDGDEYYIPETFPVIEYGQEWAKITIEGTNVQNVPVYHGESNSIMAKGVGHYTGSRFPGQNGNIVLSNHVTTAFRCLESLPIGTRITLDTIYGQYVYEVEETVIFTPDDPSYLLPDDGTERLTCYTCYPYRTVGPRTKRYAVLCKKISGENWITGTGDGS
mgnify:CR=1 FL=1